MIAFLAFVACLGTSQVHAQLDPKAWFYPNEDQLWSLFLQEPCTLIEEVPIVGRVPDVSPTAGVLSTVLGYEEREFPFPGLHDSKRLRQLAVLPLFQRVGVVEREFLVKSLRDNTDDYLAMFLKVAGTYVKESEGAIRSRILQTYKRATIEETFQAFARTRLETVRIQKHPFRLREPIERAIDAKKPVILSVAEGKWVYAAIGYSRRAESLIVTDPESAKAKAISAQDVLLTEQDRKSSGKLATRARTALAKEVLYIDEVSSCTGSRPRGLRFLNPGRLVGQAEIHIIEKWELDELRLQQLLQKRR